MNGFGTAPNATTAKLSRKNDIPILIKHFLKKYNNTDLTFKDDALNILLNYNWPGNIRELENLIRMLLVTNSGNTIEKELLPPKILNQNKKIIDKFDFTYDDYKVAYNNAVSNFDKSFLVYHLKKNNYNISKTAESINLSRVSLHKKIQEYSIQIP